MSRARRVPNSFYIFIVCGVAILVHAGQAMAQSSDIQLPDITVLGAATPDAGQAVPSVSELSGARLDRKKQSTVGETLSHETGVTSSYFGPNASRPVIRGLEGDRIRVLQNGTGVLDASAASQDHAVASDTLNIERIETIRGPAALLYGSSAVGGVVNLVTKRIPEKIESPLEGKGETHYSTVDQGRAGAVSLNGKLANHWAAHVDGSLRATDDYRIPGYARTAAIRGTVPAAGDEAKGRVYNSGGRTGEYAGGTSYVFDKGFLGGSVSSYESTYGTVAERFVHINMLQQRFDLAGERRDLGWVKSIRAKNSYSHYKHDEIENGSLGTSFKNDGDEARVEVQHQPVAGLAGMFGAQGTAFDFSAKGEEAFLPGTHNQNYSVFIFEQRETGRWRPSFGLRADQNQVRSKDDSTFGPGVTKNFNGLSASLGLVTQITKSESIVLNSAYTERAPNYEELFADGAHVATAIFERGSRDLGLEKSQSAELTWRHKGEGGQGSAGVFLQDFRDFITLTPTGAADAASGLPIYDYRAVDARLYGAELEYRFKLPSLIPGGALELEAKGDMVRGVNRSSGDNLPRMTPYRESLGLIYKANRFDANAEVQRSERQTRTAPNETTTDAYTFVNLGLEVPIRIQQSRVSLIAKAANIFDQEARNHVSVIKDLAPLPGRNFTVGLQAAF